MGTTANYAIPYPEPEDFVKDGANAMQAIAEAVDALTLAADLPDLLVLAGSATDPDANSRVTWDTGSPIRSRGSWTFPAGGRLIIPPAPGWYFVSAGFTPDPTGGVGGGTGFNTYGIVLETMTAGGDPDTDATHWQVERQSVHSDTSEECKLHVAGVVQVDAVVNRGIQVVISLGSMPGVNGDTGARLQIVRLSGLG